MLMICPWSKICEESKKENFSHCEPHDENGGCERPMCGGENCGPCIEYFENENIQRAL